jgi:inorganic pyrophosphatase
MINPWHDVSYGKNAPNEVNAIIEVPKDSRLKYELDKETGLLRLDRALYSSIHYPGDYGFIPRTYWDDNDPLDIMVISNFPVYPLTIVKARPIGIIEMKDSEERDDKIIAVHAADPRFNNVRSLRELPQHLIVEIRNFFEIYKELQGKKVTILDLKDVAEARRFILKGIHNYDEHFSVPKKFEGPGKIHLGSK